MPISFAEALSIGDVLDISRHTMHFPNTPVGGEGKALTLRHGAITLPGYQVTKVERRPFGWPVSYAGRRTTENTLAAEFLETTGAPAIRSLVEWQDLCHGIKTNNHAPKSAYAVNCKITLYDTTGKYALVLKAYNVWPTTVALPDLPEESTAAHIHVEFSVDALDIEGIKTADYSSTLSTPVRSYPVPSLSQVPRSGFAVPSFTGGNPLDTLLNVLPSQLRSSDPVRLISKFI